MFYSEVAGAILNEIHNYYITIIHKNYVKIYIVFMMKSSQHNSKKTQIQ